MGVSIVKFVLGEKDQILEANAIRYMRSKLDHLPTEQPDETKMNMSPSLFVFKASGHRFCVQNFKYQY